MNSKIDKKCEVENCSNLVEDASALDMRSCVCADHLMEIVSEVDRYNDERQDQ